MEVSQKIINDARSYTISSSNSLLPPIISTLPVFERDGSICVNQGVLKFFNEASDLWLPYAVGSGSITPALTGVENLGTSAGSVPLFLGYDTTTFPEERYVELAKIAPGPIGSITITPTALPNGSILIDTASGFGIYTFSNGGTIVGNTSLVASGSPSHMYETVGLDAGTGISLNTTGTDVTIASTITFQDGGATPGRIPLVATASTATTFEMIGLDAGTGISITPLTPPNVTDVRIASTIILQNVGLGQTLVQSPGPGTLQTMGLKAGPGISLTPPAGTDVTIATTVNLSNGGVDPAHVSLVAAGEGTAPDLKTVGLVAGLGIDNLIPTIVTSVTGTDITLYGMQLRQETLLATTTGTGTPTQFYATFPYFYTGVPIVGGAVTLVYVNNLVGNTIITIQSLTTVARLTSFEIELFSAFNQPYTVNVIFPMVWNSPPDYPLPFTQFWASNNTTHTITTATPPVWANTLGAPTLVLNNAVGNVYQFYVGNVTTDCRMQMQFIF
jgi:hypothetical protein